MKNRYSRLAQLCLFLGLSQLWAIHALGALSRAEFKARYQAKTLKLTLIGMSNMGKSFRSHQLENELGFHRVDVDGMILDKLKCADHVALASENGLAGVAEWLGMPFEARYPQNAARYLELEAQALREIDFEGPGNLVVDTTGSVVHIEDEGVIRRLKDHSVVVLFEGSEKAREEMFKRYRQEPKPVIFGDLPVLGPQSLAAAYLQLLTYRTKRYSDLADVTIPYDLVRSAIPIQELLREIYDELLP